MMLFVLRKKLRPRCVAVSTSRNAAYGVETLQPRAVFFLFCFSFCDICDSCLRTVLLLLLKASLGCLYLGARNPKALLNCSQRSRMSANARNTVFPSCCRSPRIKYSDCKFVQMLANFAASTKTPWSKKKKHLVANQERSDRSRSGRFSEDEFIPPPLSRAAARELTQQLIREGYDLQLREEEDELDLLPPTTTRRGACCGQICVIF